MKGWADGPTINTREALGRREARPAARHRRLLHPRPGPALLGPLLLSFSVRKPSLSDGFRTENAQSGASAARGLQLQRRGRGVPGRGAGVARPSSSRADFAGVRGRGGPGDEHALFEERLEWEHALGAAGWTCVGWPKEHGGRGLSLYQQVIWFEEYARAGGPGRLGHIGETLAGPTIIAFGSRRAAGALPARHPRGHRAVVPGLLRAQRRLRPRQRADPCRARRRRVGHHRAEGVDVAGALGASGASCCAAPTARRRSTRASPTCSCPCSRTGVEIRPIRQITGTSEFNEVFFDGARTAAANVVGAVNNGWKVAMGTLAFERGASTLGQQLEFQNELDHVIALARAQRSQRRPRHPPAPRRRLDRPAGHAVEHAAGAVGGRRRAAPRGHDHQALLGQLAPRPRRAGHGRARPARRPGRARARLRAHRAPAPVPVHPVRHHLRAGRTRSSATSSASGPSGSRPNPEPEVRHARPHP